MCILFVVLIRKQPVCLSDRHEEDLQLQEILMKKYSDLSKEELIEKIIACEAECKKNRNTHHDDSPRIKRSLEIFQWALDHSSDAITMATPDGSPWYRNKAFESFFGNIEGNTAESICFDKTLKSRIYKTMMDGGQWTGEVDLRNDKGEIITALLRAYAVKNDDGKIINLVCMYTDISEIKASAKALLESENKYRDLVDHTPDLLYRTDLEGRITYISPSTYKLSGYTEEEAIGMKMAEEVYLYPEERKGFLDLLTKQGSVSNFQACLKRKDGSVWWASTNAHLIRDHNNNITGVEGITRDITQIKESEAERRRLEAQLTREDKMRSMGFMAGGIAHDLNNILSGIVSYPDLILTKLPDDSPLRKPMETIKNSGQRAADIVSELLTIARGVSTNKKVLNLNQIISDYITSAEHIKITRDNPLISIKTRLDNDLLNIYASETHIKKILMNLISNAAESIMDSGEIVIQTSNRYLEHPLDGYNKVMKGEYTLLSVKDSGPGISAENLNRIFEPFYTKKAMGYSGTGLGLAVVWNAVQDHGGYINVRSTPGETVFDIYLQVSRKKMQESILACSPEELTGHREKVLVIDDEEQQRIIAKELLEMLNYNVHCVNSGEDAIDYLRNNQADLLILDMIMDPGLDGLDTYKEILKIHPAQKAIITSGYSETESVAEARKLGAGEYVKKPYILKIIGKIIKDELAK